MERITTFKTPSGDEMVILPKAEYRRLSASKVTRPSPGVREALRRMKDVYDGIEPLIPHEVIKLTHLEGISRLRAWRAYRGFSVAKLAKKARFSESYLTQLENRTRKGPLGTMARLAKILGTTVDCLKD
jgi:hypothetical protein